jgi:hypothetical protein
MVFTDHPNKYSRVQQINNAVDIKIVGADIKTHRVDIKTLRVDIKIVRADIKTHRMDIKVLTVVFSRGTVTRVPGVHKIVLVSEIQDKMDIVRTDQREGRAEGLGVGHREALLPTI